MANRIHVKVANGIIEALNEKASEFGDEFILSISGVQYSPSGFTYRDEVSPVLFCGLEVPSAEIFTFPIGETEFYRIYQNLKDQLLHEVVLEIGRRP